MSPLPDIPVDSALARLFGQEQVQAEARWFSLPGGQTLFAVGDRSDQLYYVRAGRLGAFRREPGNEVQFLGVIRPGEPAGEMSLIADAPHSADVVALRDSEIIAVPREVFLEACEAEPEVMIELAKLMMLRSRQAVTRGGMGEPSVFGFVSLGQFGALRPLVERHCLQNLLSLSARSPGIRSIAVRRSPPSRLRMCRSAWCGPPPEDSSTGIALRSARVRR